MGDPTPATGETFDAKFDDFDDLARDLMVQLADARADGWTDDDIAGALATIGVERPTANALLRNVRTLSAAPEHAEVTLHLSAFSAVVRDPRDSLRVPNERVVKLAGALARAGVAETVSRVIAAEVAQQERGAAGVQLQRLRRVGMQGLIGGSGFGLFFGLSAVLQRGTAWWHLFPAAFAAAIAAYSMWLLRRGNPPSPD